MADQKTKPWLLLILGIISLVKAWEKWGKVPRPGWAYASLGTGLVLLTFCLLAFRAGRKNQPQFHGAPTTSCPSRWTNGKLIWRA
jgi:hypothetical protein